MSGERRLDPDAPADLEGMFQVWVDSDLKVQVLVFFHNNPGMIETLQGLSRRLGLQADALKEEIADHIRLGILTERQVGGKTVLMYNQKREKDVAEFVQAAVEAKIREATA